MASLRGKDPSEKMRADFEERIDVDASPSRPALPELLGAARSVDIVGSSPKGVRVDPDITEGHPGYEESGDSEIIPADRLSGAQRSEHERGSA